MSTLTFDCCTSHTPSPAQLELSDGCGWIRAAVQHVEQDLVIGVL